jgi:hypothetical protein
LEADLGDFGAAQQAGHFVGAGAIVLDPELMAEGRHFFTAILHAP